MTKKDFFNSISKSEQDVLQQFLDILQQHNINYCVIGGLAVNAYVEPVVSLDLDVVVTMDDMDKLSKAARGIFTVEEFPHSLNLRSELSDVRIQVQKDPRYQSFIRRAVEKDIMGYTMKTAALEDVFQGKICAYLDKERRASKRQKDLADILRLIEANQELKGLLPGSLEDICH
jgi:hypothetical protein